MDELTVKNINENYQIRIIEGLGLGLEGLLPTVKFSQNPLFGVFSVRKYDSTVSFLIGPLDRLLPKIEKKTLSNLHF